MTTFIREMQFEDIPQLAELYRQFWNEPSNIETMKIRFEVIRKKGMHIFLSALEEQKLVGTIMGIVCEELYGECHPFLLVENLIVDQNYRRQGIGRQLVEELEKIAKVRGCWQMILVTESNRQDACQFYAANGFQLNNTGFKKKLLP